MTTAARNSYKFTHHENVPDVPPETETTRLFDKAFGDEPLTREEMDAIAERMYGTSGCGSDYKLAGWCWPLFRAKQISRFLVGWKYNSGRFYTYYAPDRKSLRKAISSAGPCEIRKVNNPHHPRKAKE